MSIRYIYISFINIKTCDKYDASSSVNEQIKTYILTTHSLIVAPSRMLRQSAHAKFGLNLNLKQKTLPKYVCKSCGIMGIDHGR